MVHDVELELPRGMRDLEPNELDGINYIRDKFMESARIFNFMAMEPSPLETLRTLETKAGPTISQEIYSLTDKGGRKIGLRFDLTVGLTRFVTRRRDLKMPTKIASFGGVWRYDEPQAGRYRYFHQCNLEIYGSRNLASDAEIIEFMHLFLKNLGLDVTIEINHRLLVEEFIRKKLRISDRSLISEIFRIIDKLPRKGSESIFNEYGNKIDSSILKKLITFSGIRGRIPDIINNSQLMEMENVKTVVELIEMLETRRSINAVLNLGIVRGLDYYTGLVFEAYDANAKLGALAGGGRYDQLTDQFGRKDLGATGAAAGVERILLALQQRNLFQKSHRRIVYVASTSNAVRPMAMEIVSNLRKEGYVTDHDLQGRSLTKQIEDASSKNAYVAIILAPEEIERGEVIIKSLITGKEKKQNIQNLIQELQLTD